MKDKIIRVSLKHAGIHSRLRINYQDAVDHEVTIGPEVSGPEITVPDTAGQNTAQSSTTQPLAANPAELNVSFGFRDSVIPGWEGTGAPYPYTSVNFSYPKDDDPRVHAWFTGNYSNVRTPASSTLISNVTYAVKTALSGYFAAASGSGLFISPFRLGWAFRRKDGKYIMSQPVETRTINPRSPLAAILSHSFETNAVSSGIAVINLPKQLLFTISPGFGDSMDWGDITHLDIIAAPQADLIPSSMRVNGVSTVEEDGKRYRVYQYTRRTQADVINEASIQNDLRIIASIPVADLTGGVTVPVPVTDGGLANWKLLPKFSDKNIAGDDDSKGDDDQGDGDGTGGDGGNSGNEGGDGECWEPYIDKETDPMDLGMPEERKWIRSVWLRGKYDRSSLKITVYGSRHRQQWRRIGIGTRGWVDGIAMSGFRYFKVRITGTMGRNDYIDTLTFRITRHRSWR